MKKTGSRLMAILWSLGVIILITQIWAFSLESPSDSSLRSQAVVEQGLAILEQNEVSAAVFNRMEQLIRKGAHFLEFAALGFAIQWLWVALRRFTFHYFLHGLFLGLLVAVADEGFQILAQRTSQVRDILIDFAGVAVGSCVTLVMFGLWKLVTWRRWHG